MSWRARKPGIVGLDGIRLMPLTQLLIYYCTGAGVACQAMSTTKRTHVRLNCKTKRGKRAVSSTDSHINLIFVHPQMTTKTAKARLNVFSSLSLASNSDMS